MANRPPVSVLIASYNHARYLPECLDSVLAQTYRGFEIIVVDDGSSDDSHALLLAYSQRYPEQIKYYWHPGHANRGISATFNRALAEAQGRYLAWIGSDDVWHPDKLRRQVAVLDTDPGIALVYGPAQFIDASGQKLPGLTGIDVTADPNPVGRMIQSCHTPAMTVILRRKCLDRVGEFDEALVYSDWALMVRVFAHYRAFFLDEPLAMYRQHDQNTSKGIEPHLDLERVLAVMRSLRRDANAVGGELDTPRNRALLDLQIAYLLFCSGDRSGAAGHLHRAFEDDPALSIEPDAFRAWLESWKPEFYDVADPHFGFWAIAHLPPGVDSKFRREVAEWELERAETKDFYVRRAVQHGLTPAGADDLGCVFDDQPPEIPLPGSWQASILGEAYATLLFQVHRFRDLRQVRTYWMAAIRHRPAYLLNRGVWSIISKAYTRPLLALVLPPRPRTLTKGDSRGRPASKSPVDQTRPAGLPPRSRILTEGDSGGRPASKSPVDQTRPAGLPAMRGDAPADPPATGSKR